MSKSVVFRKRIVGTAVLAALALAGCLTGETPPGGFDQFVAVASISTNVPRTIAVNTEYLLAGLVLPETATNKDIVWSVKSAGGTGAVIRNEVLNAKSAGSALVIIAKVDKGKSATADFTQEFTITVIEPKSVKAAADDALDALDGVTTVEGLLALLRTIPGVVIPDGFVVHPDDFEAVKERIRGLLEALKDAEDEDVVDALYDLNDYLATLVHLTFIYDPEFDILCEPGTQVSVDLSGAVKGGKPPYTFTAAGLPEGLEISAAGVISGTAEEEGIGDAIIIVTDSAKEARSITITYKVAEDVNEPVVYTSPLIYDAVEGVLEGGTSAGEIPWDQTVTLPASGTKEGFYLLSFALSGALNRTQIPGSTFPMPKGAITARADWKATEGGGSGDGGGSGLTLEQQKTMVYIPGMTVTGSGSDGAFPSGRTVTLSEYMIGRYEVTWGLWQAVKTWNEENGGRYAIADAQRGANTASDSDNQPVTKISWQDAVVWCNAYSAMEEKTPVYYSNGACTQEITSLSDDTVYMKDSADGYRLPTEAEWEAAARGGNPTNSAWGYLYAGSNTLDAVAWYSGTADRCTYEAGTKAANSASIFDLSGNVFEWCFDWNGDVETGTAADPTGAASGFQRIIRGGAYTSPSSSCAVTYRYSFTPSIPAILIGFRVVCRSAE